MLTSLNPVQGLGGDTIRLPDGRRLGWAEWGYPDGRPLRYFHGWPGSRAEGRFGDQAAKAHGVRLIAPDRLGMGRSDFQPRRRFLDWPDDVTRLTEALGLERFAVFGVSGGSPYVAVCAWKLPLRLTGAGIASGFAPLDAPGVTAGMGRQNRLLFGVVGRLPVLPRLLLGAMAVSASRWPDRVLERGVAAAVDRRYLARPQLREVLSQSLVEALRGGGRGAAWELGLYGRPWGVRLEEIRVPVHLWHGEQDANAPVAMGRQVAAAIPDCRASFFPGRGICISWTACRRSWPPCVRDRLAARRPGPGGVPAGSCRLLVGLAGAGVRADVLAPGLAVPGEAWTNCRQGNAMVVGGCGGPPGPDLQRPIWRRCWR